MYMLVLISHINCLVILDAKKNPHGILVINKTHPRIANAISHQPLDLWLHLSSLLEWNHEKLVFGWTENRLAEEYPDSFTILISEGKRGLCQHNDQDLTPRSPLRRKDGKFFQINLLRDIATASMVGIS